MLRTPKNIAFFCITILSAVSFFWLIAHILVDYPILGNFHQNDPDSILFTRLLEQSLLRGKISQVDNYGCYPYEIQHGFAPFFLYFLVNATGLFYSVFPSCTIDPIYVAGFLPIIVVWLTGVMITLGVWWLSTDSRMVLLTAFFMLPGIGASLTAELVKLDYDFLISFHIWVWLLLGMFFLHSPRGWHKIVGGISTALFVATWSGVPLFYFLITLYGTAVWVACFEESESFNEYAYSTMLIGGTLNVLFIFLWFSDARMASLSKYSLFQPLCVMTGGLFLYLLNYLKRFRYPRTLALIILCLLGTLILIFFGEQLKQSTGLLFKKDPVHETISELASMISFSSLDKLGDITRGAANYLGWPVFLLSLMLILRMPGFPEHSGRLIRTWLVIMILLSVYQLRFLRWPGIGTGLYAGLAAYLLWHLVSRELAKCQTRNYRLVLIFLPLFLVFSLQSFNFVKNHEGLSDQQVEIFNWIARNTPPTSGYGDEKRPEYSILSYWDEGNLISYYTKRPVAVNNAMWGFKTMADVFSARSEDEAWNLCQEYGVKYIYLSTFRQYADKSYGLWPFFKDLPKRPEYVLQYKDVPIEKKYDDWFYFWLLDNLALTPKGNFSSGSRFRAVYAAKAEKKTLAPYILFERVAGARLQIKADPGTEAVISLELKVSSQELIYKVKKIADQEGNVNFVLPYTTAHHSGRITTDVSYRLGYHYAGRHIRAAVFVDESDVTEGLYLKPVEQP